jgi:hypothetical protein
MQHPQQQFQHSLESVPPKRTTVKVNTKKLANVLKHNKSSKIHAQEEDVEEEEEEEVQAHYAAHSSKSKSKSQSNPQSNVGASRAAVGAGAGAGDPGDHQHHHHQQQHQQHHHQQQHPPPGTSDPPPEGGKSQDYLGLVQIHNLQRPFQDRRHTIKCVLCQRVVPDDIFFPCEHKVVCRG